MNISPIAIIILNWNYYNETISCLKDIINKISEHDHIFVVENGSLNSSLAEITNFIEQNNLGTKISLVPSNDNLGFSGGINFAYKSILNFSEKFDFLFLLNNDARIESDTLDKLKKLSTQKKALCTPDLYDFNSAKTPYFKANTWPNFLFGFINKAQTNFLKSSYSVSSYVEGSALLIPMNFILQIKNEKNNFMNEDFFLYCEDVDLCLKAKDSHYSCLIDHSAKAFHAVSVSGGGKGNKYAYYYITRNRILLANLWLNKPMKIIFHIYYTPSRLLLICIRLVKNFVKDGNTDVATAINSAVFQGLIDGYRNITGKWKNH